ncbi:MAG: radical SAM protein [Terrisporobacter sp.]
MRYEGNVYRPPSEANSLIIQITIGCARNTCTFCKMYKDKRFRIRKLEEVVEDLEIAKQYYHKGVKRIFLADGDALIVKTRDLLYILNKIKELFPNIERISAYGTPKDILDKSLEELKVLKEAGLDMLYVGLESGDDVVLKNVKKGVSADEIIRAGKNVKEANITLSMTAISGLGGRERLEEHALNTAYVVSEIKPEYLGFLTLMVDEDVPIYKEIQSNKMTILSPTDVAEEMKIFLENVDSEGTVFRSNHASNYVPIAGTLNKDKELMIRDVEEISKHKDFVPERYREF